METGSVLNPEQVGSVDLDFWNQRWRRGETRFHQVGTNPWLAYYYGIKGPPLEKRAQLRVFVPLCGKSADMAWLIHNGYQVVGVECSGIAVREFFRGQGMTFSLRKSKRFDHYIGDRIEILQGDFFDLQAGDLGEVSDVFDRAALIALPPTTRKSYAHKITELLRRGTRTLLITLSYPQHEMDGPPFSVEEAEIRRLYAEHHRIDRLAAKDTLAQEPRFSQRGLTSLTETAFKLTLERKRVASTHD